MVDEKIIRITTKGCLPDGRVISSYRVYPSGSSPMNAARILDANRNAFPTLSDTILEYVDGKEEQYVYSSLRE